MVADSFARRLKPAVANDGGLFVVVLEPISRHCEPTGRANARPMTGSAKQSILLATPERMDCFVALFLAMTVRDLR
jgi:hypothetical protein